MQEIGYVGSMNQVEVFVAGFGFSDKPQSKYGFDYTLRGRISFSKSRILLLLNKKVSKFYDGSKVSYGLQNMQSPWNLWSTSSRKIRLLSLSR